MANTKSLNPAERKKAKRQGRAKNRELYKNLSKADRKRFIAQIKDKKSKSKTGIVAFTNEIEKKKKEAQKTKDETAGAEA